MRITPAPSVDQQPHATLRAWRIVRLPDGDSLAGLCQETVTVRLTTPIQHFDRQSRRAITTSGRCYQLAGEPLPSVDVLLGLEALLSRYGIATEAVVDVTAEYLAGREPHALCSNGVPIYRETNPGGGWTDYVLMRDIPAEHQAAFGQWITGSACPVPSDPSRGEAVYPWDYERYLRLKPR